MSVQGKADQALARFDRFIKAMPNLGTLQRVPASALLRVLKTVEPQARQMAGMMDGAIKAATNAPAWEKMLKSYASIYPWMRPAFAEGAYSGAGTMTGKVITPDDKKTANAILYEIETRLPQMGEQLVEPWLYAQVRSHCLRLQAILTDMDVAETFTDNVTRAWESLKEAVVELPQNIDRARKAVVPDWMLIGGALLAGLILLKR